MISRHLRIPVWLMAVALLTTFVIGSKARPVAGLNVRPAFRIVTPSVSEIITQDITPEIAEALQLPPTQGVLISEVVYSPLQAGDVILSINGNAVPCQKELDAQLAQLTPGQAFLVEVYRNGRIQTVTVQQPIDTPPVPTVLQGSYEIRGITVASLSTENGVIVADVQIGTPASDIGLKRGDIILDVDGHPVHSADQFVDFMRQLNSRAATFNVMHRSGLVDVFVISA